MNALAPLQRTTVEIVGVPFHAIFSPEDGAIRAAGFATGADPHGGTVLDRLAAVDPETAARGVVDVSPDETDEITIALRTYAAGDLTAIGGLTVTQPETPFHGKVWRALRRVPPGAPVTYTELAAMAARPSAVRAAATGCANNLVILVVPCHRIVRSDGGLGGYVYGTDIKRRLLEHESAAGAGSSPVALTSSTPTLW